MGKATVYRFVGYDIGRDELVESQRYATKEFILRHGFEVLTQTRATIDEAQLDDGLAPRGLNPNSVMGEGGFQTHVQR